MRVVLDTNQFVSALIRTGGHQDQIIQAWREERMELALSPAILEEVEEVLRRPHIQETYELTEESIAQYLAMLRAYTMLVPGVTDIQAVAEDPDDNMVLACAVEAGADYIVSGDHHLLNMGEYQGIPILRASVFLAILGEGDTSPGESSSTRSS